MSGRHAAGHASPKGTATGGRRGRPTRLGPAGRLASWWRRLTGSASAVVVAFGLLTFACTLLAVAGPRASEQLRTGAFRQLVAQTPAVDKTVIGTTDDNTMSAGLTPGIDDQQILLARALLQRHLSALPLGPAATSWSGLTTPIEPIADNYPAGLGSDGADLELSYRSALGRYVRVIAGSLPAGQPTAGATTTLQAAVTQATARRFGFTVGSRVTMANQVVLQITGIVQPDDPAAPFWTYDPLLSTPQLAQPPKGEPYWQSGAFIAGSAVIALQTRFQQDSMQVSMMFPLSLGQLTAAQATQLAHTLAGSLASAGAISINGNQFPMEVDLSSAVAALVGDFTAASSAVASLLALLSVSLAVVGAAVVLLAAWLLADKRREEFWVLRARGASRRQLALAASGGSVIGALPGLAAGAVLASVLTPGGVAPLSWWLAGLVAAASVAGPVLITVLAHRRVTGTAVRADAPAGRTTSARRLVAEAGLSLAAVGGLIVLRDQGAGAAGGDFYPAAAPVLVAVPVAIVALRLYPLVVRVLLRLRGGRAGASTFVGLARAARVPASAALPAFAMVLAFGLVSFAGMVRGSVVRGEVAASWQEAGADAVISGPADISPAQQAAIAAVPGVSRVLSVSVLTGELAESPVSVMVADPRQYASYLSATPLPAVPTSFAARRPAGAALPVLASPGLAAELGKGPVEVMVGQGDQQVQVEVAGQAASMSAVAILGGPSYRGYLVLPASAVTGAGPASTLLVAGAGVDRAALTAVLNRVLPGASVIFRSVLLAHLESAPLQHGTYLALALGGDAAVAACLLALLLTLLMSGSSREMTLARMTTMGLSAGQGRRLALVEALPQVVAVLAGGLVCAAALAILVGPALSLSVFTGSPASVPVRLEPLWLLATAAGLLVLVLLTLAGQTVVASRGTPRSLRIGG